MSGCEIIGDRMSEEFGIAGTLVYILIIAAIGGIFSLISYFIKQNKKTPPPPPPPPPSETHIPPPPPNE
jgi:hypothetical protein